MSIQTELQRLRTAKSSIRNAIQAKNVTVPADAKISSYPAYIDSIITSSPEYTAGLLEGTITDYTVPSNVTEIAPWCLYAQSNLRSLTAPNVTTLGFRTFTNCSSLVSVSIPKLTTLGGAESFGYCGKLASIDFPKLTYIGDNAFIKCTALSSVSLPLVETIEAVAFGLCTSLTSVSLPSIKTIAVNAFSQCSSLTSFEIGSKAANIVTNFYGCTNLTTITCHASTPPDLEYGLSYTVTKLEHIYVPASSVDAYKSATNWSAYADKIYAIS